MSCKYLQKKITKRNGFEFFFQPQVVMGDSRVLNVEALLRFKGEDGAVISPYSVNPELQILSPDNMYFHLWCLNEIMEICASWQLKKIPLNVAFNVSASIIASDKICETILQHLKNYSIDSGRFIIECTEQESFINNSHAINNLDRLRYAGVPIYIDDFGAGFNDMNMVSQVPCDVVKFDKSYVSMSDSSERERAKIMLLSQSLLIKGKVLLIEGIENYQQESFFKAIGFYMAQGYYYSKPLSGGGVMAKYGPIEI